ncbi:PBP1A family penicillin-binding protein [Patescibacteria group bacterium]|nr:PBP1A family penicillin-binding protein [Patescibacteria group bacterium]
MAVRKKYRVTSSNVKRKIARKSRVSFRLPTIKPQRRTPRKRLIKKSFSTSLLQKIFKSKTRSNLKSKRKSTRLKKIFRTFLKLSIAILLIGVIGLIGIFLYFSKDIPDPDKIANRNVAESTKIYDRTGDILLYEIHGEEKRTVVKLNQISTYVLNATMATEDQDFYKHHGVDFRGIARAIYRNVISGEKLQGGSTITQQLIKNSILTSERTFTRKIKEIILAVETEQKFSKDEIMEMYLNQIPYGSNAYGIEAAARTFFDKSAKDLDISEAVLLAGLPKATTYYSPYGAHPEALEYRYHDIIGQMLSEGYISQEQADEAWQVDILKKIKPFREDIKAPHFVMYVRQQIVDEFGEERVERGGLNVYTTLNYDMQLIAEDAVKIGVEKNIINHNAKNAALVAIDPHTGQVLSMVGSKNYFSIEEDGNVNVAISNRQPGSSFKPFVYATAFKKGYTPDTILFDVETNFGKDGSGKEYIPQNYNFKFSGPVTIRQALARSLNIPAVKALYLAGIDDSVQMAHNLGITTLNNPDNYGLSLVLGTGEVKLIDMVASYGVFANEGKRNISETILKIEDSSGEIIKQYEKNEKEVLDLEVARNINNILSDNVARTPTFGAKNMLYLGERPVAAKTGTTSDYKDGWTVGYTPSLVAGVWAGNNKGEKMKQGGGITVAAPIWNDFMSRVLALDPIEKFVAPEKIKTDKAVLNGEYKNEVIVKIDKACGDKLASELTPESQIIEKIYIEAHNILHYVNKDNPQGESPKDFTLDSSYQYWEQAVLDWAEKNAREKNENENHEVIDLENDNSDEIEQKNISVNPPTEICSVREDDKMPILKITSPQEDQIIKNNKLAIKAEAFTVFGLKQIDIHFDGNLVGVGKYSPYEVAYNIPAGTKEGLHNVSIKVYDQIENSVQKDVPIIMVSDDSSVYLKPIVETDFPYIIDVVTSTDDIRYIDFYYQLDSIYNADMELVKKTGIKKKIGTADYPVPGEDKLYQILWEENKEYFISGKYKIFTEMVDGSGKIYESNKRFLEVK